MLSYAETAAAAECAPERILPGVRRNAGPADAVRARGLTGTNAAGIVAGPTEAVRASGSTGTGAAGACADRPDGIDGAAVVFTGAATDSRQVAAGNIFFCLKGEKVDGHDFALDAAAAGAGAVVALRDPFPAEARNAVSGPDLPPVFLVDNVEDALCRLAARHRGNASATVIGLTGTAGKTTVKEALAAVLGERGRTERNPMNLNNSIGMPLSMLNADPNARFWVMEAGVSRVGDMEELARVLRPDAVLILNVGVGHAEGLGKGGAAAEKARLLDFIQPGGTALVSADYPELDRECAARSAAFAARNIRCLRFSARGADVRYRARRLAPGEQADFATTQQGDLATTHQADPATTQQGDLATTHQADPATTQQGDLATTQQADLATTHQADRATTHQANFTTTHAGDRVLSLRGRYAVCVDGVEFVCEAPFFGSYGGSSKDSYGGSSEDSDKDSYAGFHGGASGGDCGAENVAAVAAVALSLGLEPDDVRRGLAAAETPAQRFAVRHFFVPGRGRYILVDDSYNANPLSAGRVIPAAGDAAREAGLPFVPVLGEMLELGEESPAAHEKLGEIVASTRPAAVFWTGGQADSVRRGLHRGGLSECLEELPACAEDFAARMEAMGPALVLFKGSRANRLERWVEALLHKAGDDAQPAGEPRACSGQRPDTRRGAGDAHGNNARMRTKGDGRVL